MLASELCFLALVLGEGSAPKDSSDFLGLIFDFRSVKGQVNCIFDYQINAYAMMG